MRTGVGEFVRTLSAEGGFAAQLRRRAGGSGLRLVLPEAEDPRILRASIALREFAIADPILLAPPIPVRRRLQEEGVDPSGFTILDPREDVRAGRVAERLYARRRAKGLTQGEAVVLAREALHLGAGLVALGEADAMLAGAVHTTGEVIRAGLFHVGLAEGIDVVSGYFLMVPPEGHPFGRPLLLADTAVLPEPTDDQLLSIGLASARSWARLVGERPKVACLSFSTHGSADHPSARRMRALAGRLCEAGVLADGELQIDAALVEEVARSKAPDSPVAGRADVLLFPDLASGNIGYKIAQRLGGFLAIGPILQGLARPVFDLSRGCDAAAIVNAAAIAALTSGAETES